MTNKEILKQIEENEKAFLKDRRFKLKNDPIDESLQSSRIFLEWFLNEENTKISNWCVWESFLESEDIEEKQKQCRCGANRSTHDLFLLCRHYFPEITLLQVIQDLVWLNENFKISTLQCPNISARVWFSYVTEYETPKEPISHYDRIHGKDEDGIYKKRKVQTNGLNYLDLKQIYEYYCKEEECAAKAELAEA